MGRVRVRTSARVDASARSVLIQRLPPALRTVSSTDSDGQEGCGDDISRTPTPLMSPLPRRGVAEGPTQSGGRGTGEGVEDGRRGRSER